MRNIKEFLVTEEKLINYPFDSQKMTDSRECINYIVDTIHDLGIVSSTNDKQYHKLLTQFLTNLFSLDKNFILNDVIKDIPNYIQSKD